MILTPNQHLQFETQGYLVLPDVLDAPTLDALRADYAQLLGRLCADWHTQGRVPPPTGDFMTDLRTSYAAGCDWFQPMDISLPGDRVTQDTPFQFSPATFAMLTHPHLLDIVAELIGPEITSNPIQHIRLKPPRTELATDETRAHITQTDWHQDRAVAHADGDGTQMVTVWLAITDATLDNGCLQVIPGRPQMYPHCPKTQTAIADGCIDPADAVPLPVKAGGAVIFHPLTPHALQPNTSDTVRWSFDIRYNITGQPTGRAHFPSFVARSAAHPDTVLTDWQDWRDLWHAARARLAGAPHIPIHRWTSDAPACA